MSSRKLERLETQDLSPTREAGDYIRQGKTIRLLPGREVALAGAKRQVFLQGADFDGAIAAVGIELGWLVGDDVLAAQLVLNGGERVGNVFIPEREKRPAAGGRRLFV